MSIAAPFGTAFEIILPMTDTLTVSNAGTNLVHGVSQGAKTLTLPSIQAMIASQNFSIQVTNASGSGGTITVAANAADAIVGQTAVLVATGVTYKHNGLHTWFST
jgi:tripartite-type tricarboxylate transporter receptor subunit TctC